MRAHLRAVGLTLALTWSCHVLRADDSSPTIGEDGSPSPSVKAILKEAAQIASRQDEEQAYWCERALLRIAELQMRAGDFDGARDSIAKCNNSYGANASSVRLAEALAGAGDRERAFQVLREMGTDHGWRQDFLDDGVRMRWLEYLISTRDFRRADLAVEEFAVPNSRPVGLRTLALAYAEGGDNVAARRCLQDAIVACTPIADEFTRQSACGKSPTLKSPCLMRRASRRPLISWWLLPTPSRTAGQKSLPCARLPYGRHN